MKSLSTYLCLGACAAAAWGCGSASASGQAKADTDKKDPFAVHGESAWDMNSDETQADDVPDAPAKKKADPAKTAAKPSQTQAKASAPAGEPALLGARHDLYLGKGAPTPCRCLAVVAGSTSAAGLVWSGARPTLDASSQLVVALSSDEIPCDTPQTGASYQGYERDGENVVVRVEAAKPGRPVTHGAIVPKPTGSGKLLIQAASGTPYGRGPAGEARCVVTPTR